MTVKKKPASAKPDPKEIEAAFHKTNADIRKRDAAKAKSMEAASVKDKKTTRKRVEQVLKNDLVKVEVLNPDIPIENDHISATAIDGLMDYQIAGTHLRLLCMADPTAVPNLEQRVAMARRLNEVGPYLPRYVKTVSMKPGKGISDEEVKDSKDRAEAIAEGREAKAEAEAAAGEERGERRERREARKPKVKTREPIVSRTAPVQKMLGEGVVNGVPLKKICSEIDIDPKDARMILRKKKVDKPGGRWEWTKEDAENVKAILVKGKAEL